VRRFVALPVPADVRGALATAIDPLRSSDDRELRWAKPDGWHITLAFLGEVDDDAVASVVEVVGGALGRVAPPRSLRLAGAGRFSHRVLWAGVDDEPAGSVAALGAAIQTALVDAALPVQEQPVAPHVTLARSRKRRSRGVTEDLVARVDVPEAGWTVDTVELWRSELGGGPARYEVDAALPVG
jgi:RNA 2',3'-cyclic 3'-phosphodiesterase